MKNFLLMLAVVLALFGATIVGCKKNTSPTAPNSTNAGATWIKSGFNAGAGMAPAQIFSSGTDLYASSYGVFRSSDSGASWSAAQTGIRLDHGDISSFAIGADLFVGTSYGVYRSQDRGSTWSLRDSGVDANIPAVGNVVQSGSNIFLSGKSVGLAVVPPVYRSTDHGESWMASATGLPTGKAIFANTLAAAGTSVYAEFSTTGWFRSTDAGASWQSLPGAALPSSVNCMAVGPNGHMLAGTGNIDLYEGLYESTDGKTWKALGTFFHNHFVRSIAVGDSNIFAVMSDVGTLWRSTNSGTNWTDITTGITSGEQVTAVAICNGYLFAGTVDASTNGGVWRRPMTDFK